MSGSLCVLTLASWRLVAILKHAAEATVKLYRDYSTACMA